MSARQTQVCMKPCQCSFDVAFSVDDSMTVLRVNVLGSLVVQDLPLLLVVHRDPDAHNMTQVICRFFKDN